MKLQNLTIIFIIIAIPIILLMSYYIKLQIDTITLQTMYNNKLIESTKEALDAFEINTVEWNSEYSEVAGSKRRDITASINSFITSLSNNLGINGIKKDLLLNYIPGIVYTLYDGYYIYGPSNLNSATDIATDNIDDVNISTSSQDNSQKISSGFKINRAGDDAANTWTLDTSDNYILQPFTAYSENVTSNGNTYTINYTLDNYVTVYSSKDDEFIKSGNIVFYSEKPSFTENADGTIQTEIKLKSDEKFTVKSELLKEKIQFKEYNSSTSNVKTGTYSYIYTSDKNKVYYDETNQKFFYLAKSGYAYYLSDEQTIDNQYMYKKIYLFNYEEKYYECYQAINGPENIKGKFFIDYDGNGIITPDTESIEAIGNVYGHYFSGTELPIYQDCSAINYYFEAYEFSKWFQNNVLKFEDQNEFITHKNQIIRTSIEKALSRLSVANLGYGVIYRIPKIEEEDWGKILSNVSIITFMQGMPIGTKYYNNYAYATSTKNKEYVNPGEIYLVSDDNADTSYHKAYCSKINSDISYTGYRNIDFVIKNNFLKINDEENEEKATQKYYAHEQSACYYCMVERGNYQEKVTTKTKNIYETALARERYATYKEVNGVTDTISQAKRNIRDGISISNKIKTDINLINNELGTFKNCEKISNVTGQPKEEILSNAINSINKVVANSKFYNMALLDGTFKDKKLQYGDTSDERIDLVDIPNLSTDSLGINVESSEDEVNNALSMIGNLLNDIEQQINTLNQLLYNRE